MTAPKPGSIAWMRAFHGDQFRRGAEVIVHGERARITSTAYGRVAVRVWSTGKRVVVLPHEVDFEPAGELALI